MRFRTMLLAAILLLLSAPVLAQGPYAKYRKMVDKAPFIVISKADFKLVLADDKGDGIASYDICLAVNYGNKEKEGDHKTPEGVFAIREILDATNFTHDFHDGRGPVKGSYGKWFMRLNVTNFRQIGIHGTDRPESIGTRASEGCIRLTAEGIIDLKPRVKAGTPVIILKEGEKF